MLVTRVDVQRQATGVVLAIVGPTGRRLITYGTMALGDKRSVGGDTVFEVGSITKVFTACSLPTWCNAVRWRWKIPWPSTYRLGW